MFPLERQNRLSYHLRRQHPHFNESCPYPIVEFPTLLVGGENMCCYSGAVGCGHQKHSAFCIRRRAVTSTKQNLIQHDAKSMPPLHGKMGVSTHPYGCHSITPICRNFNFFSPPQLKGVFVSSWAVSSRDRTIVNLRIKKNRDNYSSPLCFIAPLQWSSIQPRQ